MQLRYSLFLIVVSALVVVSLLLGGQGTVAEQSKAAPSLDLNGIDAYVREQVEANRIPGLALAVVKEGQVVMLKGYGEARSGQPMTGQTQLYIGSVTKSFTALAVMQLVEQGKLELNAPVQRYLPWFQTADAQASAQITVRHLLNHTSGLSEEGDPASALGWPTLVDDVRGMRQARLTAPVGSKYQYYNQNYRVLGLLVEQVSGQTYGDYLRANVLGPLGMTRTATSPDGAPGLAQGHGQMFGFPFPRAQDYTAGSLPSGYLISSAEDMARYMIALLNDGKGSDGSKAIAQPATLAQMFTAPPGIGSSYGMGWVIGEDPDVGRFYWHNGDIASFHADVALIPGTRTGLALLYNQGGLLTTMLASNQIFANGVGELLVGGTAQPASLWLVHLMMAVGAALALAAELFYLWRLRRWAGRGRGQRRWISWVRALAELVVGALLLVSVPVAGGAMLGGGGWGELYAVLPDVAVFLIAAFGLISVAGLARVAILMWQRSARRTREKGPIV